MISNIVENSEMMECIWHPTISNHNTPKQEVHVMAIEILPKPKRVCQVQLCDAAHYSKGYCAKHYQQFTKHGFISLRTVYTPNDFIENSTDCQIILYNQEQQRTGIAIIDKDDIELCKKRKWYLTALGYVESGPPARRITLQNHIMGHEPSLFIVVDHINRNRLDNRKCNLRICAKAQNNVNRQVRSDNKVQHTGVSYHKQAKKWRAYITPIGGKHLALGLFNSIAEAVETRKKAEEFYYGEYTPKGA